MARRDPSFVTISENRQSGILLGRAIGFRAVPGADNGFLRHSLQATNIQPMVPLTRQEIYERPANQRTVMVFLDTNILLILRRPQPRPRLRRRKRGNQSVSMTAFTPTPSAVSPPAKAAPIPAFRAVPAKPNPLLNVVMSAPGSRSGRSCAGGGVHPEWRTASTCTTGSEWGRLTRGKGSN